MGRWKCAVWLTVIVLAPLPAGAVELQPHRAVYDVSLTSAEPSADVTAANGRLVFELSGAACEGYVVNSRFVTRVTDREGEARVTDLRSTTFEELDPATFDFLNQTFVDGVEQEAVKGQAVASPQGLTVTLNRPEAATLELSRGLFPTAHTRFLLEAAASGDRLAEAPIFDGGNEADTVYQTTAVIGSGRTGLPGASAAERNALSAIDGVETLTGWRITLSYFELGQAGEATPAYEIAFTMLENGIAYDVRFGYGSFELSGDISELSLATLPDC